MGGFNNKVLNIIYLVFILLYNISKIIKRGIMVRPSFIKSLNENDTMTLKDWIIEILWYNPFMTHLRKIGRFLLSVFT